jgi:DNA primase
MPRVSEQTIEQIRNTADIVEVISGYVELKKRGRNYFGLCPFHGEKTASFSVNTEKQIYKCFGCNVGGGVINFIMEIEGLEFLSAIKHLANQYSIELDINNISNQNNNATSKLFDIHEQAANIFLNNLNTNDGLKVVSHLLARGLTKETIKKFKIGFSSNKKNELLLKFRNDEFHSDIMKNSGLFIDTKRGYIDRFRGRIMFSIFNSAGKISAFAGRVFESEDPAKYINSPETPIYNKSKILYGLHETKQNIRNKKSVIVVEGYLDFLQLYQSGIKNIVAISGTAFTNQHALQIKRFCEKVYLAYDGDSAGISAAIRAGYVLMRAGLSPQIIQIPNGLDPDDWVKKEGKRPFLQAAENGYKLFPFHFKHYNGDISTASGKASFVNEVLTEIVLIKDPINRELQGRELSELIGVSAESIFQSINSSLEKQSLRKKYNNVDNKKQTINNKKQLLENDLIRLCFSKDQKIRKFLFENINLDWLNTEFSLKVYEKIYIHLPSSNPIPPGLIIDELDNKEYRNQLSNLIFDLEKLDLTIKSAYDCISRLEKNWLNQEIKKLMENLKKIESQGENTIPLMKKIDELQIKKNKLTFKYSIKI